MFKLFKRNKEDVNDKAVNKSPVNKYYTDSELFQALQEDGIVITEQEIQKAREDDPEALYKVGDAYYNKKKYEKAFAWLHKAALQNHAEAQARVGYMYRKGEGVSIDYKPAMDWSMKAASVGNAAGQYNVGQLYYYRNGVPRDFEQAMYWFLKAANNEYTYAMKSIGSMYYHGEGVTANISPAIEWYTKAANQGDQWAQRLLGWIYQYDVQVKDLQTAVNWYQKAADNGNDLAKSSVKELKEQGYYAKEEEQEEEKTKEEEEDATTNIVNDQSQPSNTTSNNDGQFNKLMESRIDHLEKMFQSKLVLMEGNNDALQKELAALRLEKHQQNEENKQLGDESTKLKVATKDNTNNDLSYDSSGSDGEDNADTTNVNVMQGSNDALQNELAALKQRELDHRKENQRLKERLARMEAAMQNNADNDLNYDSSDNESNGNNATSNIGVKKENHYALQEEVSTRKQKQLGQHEENQLLKERPARMEIGIQDDPNNDPYYDSSDNENDDNNDINYDSECSDEEEDENFTTTNTQQRESHYHSVEIYADPNYDSSDNEGPRNDN